MDIEEDISTATDLQLKGQSTISYDQALAAILSQLISLLNRIIAMREK